MALTRFRNRKDPAATGNSLRTHLAEAETRRHPSPKSYPWAVIHACELARDVLPLVEGQLAVGMRPSLLTPNGTIGTAGFFKTGKREQARSISLLETWGHVREWKNLIYESAAETSSELLHAHSFSAGMAAVRVSSSVVYQFRRPIEKLAAAAGNGDENSWLGRSFRVAEQFVLTRAGAVVVNDHIQRLACLDRGVNAANVFLIPQPVEQTLLESVPERKWLIELANAGPDTVLLLAPAIEGSESENRAAFLRWMRVLCTVRGDNPDVRLVLLADGTDKDSISEIASSCNLMPWICVLPPCVQERALATADVVICDREHAAGGIAVQVLAHGRALLACDAEQHRDITPEGRGCLWFRAGEVSDIAKRASFLAGNPQFRRALASAGRDHCRATRSPEAVGAQYDAVYRNAFGKRKGRDANSPRPQFIPLHVGS